MPARQVVLDDPRQLTLAEVAELRRVHINTVRRWVASGYLRAERVGPRFIRVNPDDLAALGRTIPSAAAR